MAVSVLNKNVFNVYFSEGIFFIVRLQQINPFMSFWLTAYRDICIDTKRKFLLLLVRWTIFSFLVLVNATQFVDFSHKIDSGVLFHYIFNFSLKERTTLIRLCLRLFVIRKNEIVLPLVWFSFMLIQKTKLRQCAMFMKKIPNAYSLNGYQYSVLIKNWHGIKTQKHRNK